MTTKSPIATITQNKLVDGGYGYVIVDEEDGTVEMYRIKTQKDLKAAIETLMSIWDAGVLK